MAVDMAMVVVDMAMVGEDKAVALPLEGVQAMPLYALNMATVSVLPM